MGNLGKVPWPTTTYVLPSTGKWCSGMTYQEFGAWAFTILWVAVGALIVLTLIGLVLSLLVTTIIEYRDERKRGKAVQDD